MPQPPPTRYAQSGEVRRLAFEMIRAGLHRSEIELIGDDIGGIGVARRAQG